MFRNTPPPPPSPGGEYGKGGKLQKKNMGGGEEKEGRKAESEGRKWLTYISHILLGIMNFTMVSI